MNGDMFPEAVVPKVDENRRYTTRAFMHFIKRVAGVEHFDLDAAADFESHHADRWFISPGDVRLWRSDGVEHPPCDYLAGVAGFCNKCGQFMPSGVDGLASSWLPPSLPRSAPWCIFINPPFDNIGPWLAKVWATIEQARGLAIEVRIAFVMPGNRTEQGLWQDHVEPFLAGHAEENRLGYQLVAHSPRTRQFYGHPGNPEPKSGQAEWPSVVLVWRRA